MSRLTSDAEDLLLIKLPSSPKKLMIKELGQKESWVGVCRPNVPKMTSYMSLRPHRKKCLRFVSIYYAVATSPSPLALAS